MLSNLLGLIMILVMIMVMLLTQQGGYGGRRKKNAGVWKCYRFGSRPKRITRNDKKPICCPLLLVNAVH